MAVDATDSFAPAPLTWPRGAVVHRLRVRFAALRLDARLAAGEDPLGDADLACRSEQLVSMRSRRRIARGLERLCSEQPERGGFSAAIPFNRRAVEIARPALEQLAAALRSRASIRPRGVALTQVLLTEPGSAVYRPAYPDELYEVAREALFALGPNRAVDAGVVETSPC